MSQELQQLHDDLKTRLVEAQDAQAQYYDKGRKRLTLQREDYVWLLTTNVIPQARQERRPKMYICQRYQGMFGGDP